MVYYKERLMRRDILIRSVFFTLILSLFGCNSFYDSTKVYYKNTDDIINNSELLNFKVPIQVNFTGTINNSIKTYKINGIIKIKNSTNFQIFLSSKTLGIEIARVEFFNDSIIFINKFSKTSVKSTITDLSYLRGLSLTSDKVLRILTGRSFVGLNYILLPNKNEYKYTNPSNFGKVIFTNSGYIKSHNISVGTSTLNVTYADYYKKYLLPYSVNGDIFTSNNIFSFNFKYTNISPLKGNYKQLRMPITR